MHQLLSLPNVRQYNPKNGEYVTCINPKSALEAKIISGDSSDNIKGIRPRVGPKTAEKIVKEGLHEYLNGPDITPEERAEIMTKYQRNKTLIDFDFIPKNVTRNILNTFASYSFAPMQKANVMEFFKKNKFAKHMEDWSVRGPKIKLIGVDYVTQG